MSPTYSSTQNVPQVLVGFRSGLRAGQEMVVIAFLCRNPSLHALRSSIVHKYWSRGQSMVIEVREDNSFLDVLLISWRIMTALNSDQIQLAFMRNASSPHHRTTAKWNGFLNVAGSIDVIWLYLYTSLQEASLRYTYLVWIGFEL